MSRHSFFGILVAASIGSASAFAQGGTEAEQEACTPDVFRLCQAFIPDETPIVSCLKSNRTKLSPACYKVFYADASQTIRHKRRRHRVD